jgi:hypothetical protein
VREGVREGVWVWVRGEHKTWTRTAAIQLIGGWGVKTRQEERRGEERSAVAAVGRGVDRDTRDRGRDRGRPAALGERDRDDHSVSPGAMMAPAIAT